jgi:hypothetical protein
MILEYYAIKDTKVAFMNPFLQHNKAEAIRSFRSVLVDERSEAAKNPADYELWYVGQWDDATGIMMGGQPQFIENGVKGLKNAENRSAHLESI